jgi:hypothetical protein
MRDRLGVRWTMGNVSERGFEALALSVWGAYGLFGPDADYVICVNGISVAAARERTRRLPDCVKWQDNSQSVPEFLKRYLEASMTEGSGWKLAPVRMFPDRHELALDNDCILWAVPATMAEWLSEDDSLLIAEDVRRCLGVFDARCGPGNRNSGIRGLAPGVDYGRALEDELRSVDTVMTSELDEQGLQVAALERLGPVHVVTVDDVTICSPFPPHLPNLGKSGAHFVGTNARSLPWSLEGRPASEYIDEHWRLHLPRLRERVSAVAPGCPW